MNCVAYYRVSTQRQGESGLGLDAQKAAVESYIAGNRDRKLIAEFREIESGRNNKRPEIHKALALCKKLKAKLVIAKLDRLARNVHFISGLLEANVQFHACDLPELSKDRFYIHIMAAVAEKEAMMISERIKAALKQSKRKLGGHRYLRDWDAKGEKKVYLRDKNGRRIRWDPRKATAAGRAARTDNSEKRQAQLALAGQSLRDRRDQRGKKMTLAAVGQELKKLGHQPPRGGEWHPAQVARLLA